MWVAGRTVRSRLTGRTKFDTRQTKYTHWSDDHVSSSKVNFLPFSQPALLRSSDMPAMFERLKQIEAADNTLPK
jgi:hypothetical protein